MVTTESEPLTTTVCEGCGNRFAYKGVWVKGVEMFRKHHCDDCSVVRDAKIALENANAEHQRRATLWETICPPLYRETDAGRLQIAPSALKHVTGWQLNPKGLGLTGTSGTGKTRAMFLLLRRLHFEGVPMVATSAKRFEHWCHKMFDKDDDAAVHLRAARHTRLLFIDDIGKEKYTPRVESEFYDLIEHRTSHMLPILWTANATSQQLVQMMGDDRGTPIVRRLREFSEVISV